jgi:hypothetical protein
VRHLSARALARYQQGMLRATKASRVAAHLSACPQCSGAHSGLEAISRLLASTPVPPMPGAVADRIHAALATEAAARTAAPRAGRRAHALRSSRPVVFSPLILRGLAATASIAVVATVGYVFATTALGPASAPSAPGGAGRQAAAAPSAVAPGLPRKLTYGITGQSAPALVTGADYTPANLASLVHRDVARLTANGRVRPAAPAPRAAHATAGTFNALSAVQLEGCLASIDHGRRVVLADVARYLGRPATIIVLKPILAAASVFDVVVVGPGCSRATADIITTTEVPMR